MQNDLNILVQCLVVFFLWKKVLKIIVVMGIWTRVVWVTNSDADHWAKLNSVF